jgi:translation initiation factor IF-2
MSEEKNIRINKILRELNISLDRAVEYLKDKGITVEANPNSKISENERHMLYSEFSDDIVDKVASLEVAEEKKKEKESIRLQREREEAQRIEDERKKLEDERIKARTQLAGTKTVGKIDLGSKKVEEKDNIVNAKTVEEEKNAGQVDVKQRVSDLIAQSKKESKQEFKSERSKLDKPKVVGKTEPNPPITEENPIVKQPAVADIVALPEAAPVEEAAQDEKYETQYQKLSGAKLTGKVIDLSVFDKPKKKPEVKKHATPATPAPQTPKKEGEDPNKNKRKRIQNKFQGNNTTNGQNQNTRPGGGFKKPEVVKVEPTEEDVKNQIKETLEKLQGKGNKSKASKYRREKRDTHKQRTEDEIQASLEDSKVLKVTEFITVSEVATMMDVPINKIIGTCMSLGIMVTMNQRLDAEILSMVAEEFGFEVEFTSAESEENMTEYVDSEEDLLSRAPIVTVMGHVDHGKTSLLDYIRKANVIAGESGGITQHIGAYSVTLENGQRIAFLDTPGHEAFTAMRARGAQLTDIAIIVAAADDDLMPQTKEAISHAQAAGVPMIFAINKVDKPSANPEKIKEQLAGMNLLVEDWGGKYQSHDISAKFGQGVNELLEKVLLEAELLDLKANPNKPAQGVVVEAQLDKGRGYVATVLVQSGTLRVGDYMLAGKNHGKVKALHDERGNVVKEAGPATPVSVLGLDGAPGAGDKFNVFEDEREAKQLASKRAQLLREQSVRTQKHITLAEIGRRIALGQFKELNIIIKGDVDGSVEALSDSFSKLSTDEIAIKIIHKGVGAITESDVLLASASDAIIVGFNVRPAGNAKSLADKEEIDIKTYSIIYDAIDDLKDAMEGMLSPELKEEITGSAEIREIFKVTKIGNIAGCMVTDGKVFRTNKIRIIREGVVIYTGELATLKRFKDDVKEVSKGYDCGIQIKNYNDIQLYDTIESFHEVEVKKKL